MNIWLRIESLNWLFGPSSWKISLIWDVTRVNEADGSFTQKYENQLKISPSHAETILMLVHRCWPKELVKFGFAMDESSLVGVMQSLKTVDGVDPVTGLFRCRRAEVKVSLLLWIKYFEVQTVPSE